MSDQDKGIVKKEDRGMKGILVDKLSKDYKVTWVHFIYCEAY